jgi:hypothetical protein
LDLFALFKKTGGGYGGFANKIEQPRPRLATLARLLMGAATVI